MPARTMGFNEHRAYGEKATLHCDWVEEGMVGGDLIQRKFYWHNHPDFAAFSLVFAGAKSELPRCGQCRFSKNFQAVNKLDVFYIAYLVNQYFDRDFAYDAFFFASAGYSGVTIRLGCGL